MTWKPSPIRRIRSSYAYTQLMRAYRRRVPICERCRRRCTVHVHHRVPMAVDLDRWNDPTNLEGLCERCHIDEHNPPPHSGEDRGNHRPQGGSRILRVKPKGSPWTL